MIFFTGLLNYNEPLRDRPLLANEENEHYNDEEEESSEGSEEEASPHVEEGAVVVHSTFIKDEHIIIHLPPTLHKGNITI